MPIDINELDDAAYGRSLREACEHFAASENHNAPQVAAVAARLLMSIAISMNAITGTIDLH